MHPVITDRDTGRELWTAQQCADHADVSVVTWRSYVSRDQAPQSVSQLDSRTPLWDAGEVTEWHGKRRAGRTVSDG